MARLVTSGFELNKVADESDGTSDSAALTIVSTPSSEIHTGTYALQANPSANSAYIVYQYYAANSSQKIYARTWFYIVALPNVSARIIDICTVSSTLEAGIVLTPYGTLQLENNALNQVGFDSPTLNLNTWYCAEVYLDSTVANGTNEARLNGTVFASGPGTAAKGTVARIRVGLYGPNNPTGTVILDDVAANDATGSYQNGYPGMGQIVRATPNGAGDTNTFASAVGGTAGAANNYTRVSEVSPNGATSYNASDTAGASDLFKVSVPTIPGSATVNCVVIGGDFANITAADTVTAFKWQIEKTSGGTLATSAAIIPDSTTFGINTTGPGGNTFLLALYNDPDGTAWTPSTIASMQIGYTLSAVGTNPVAISTVWAYVDYTPQLSIPAHSLASLGVGS